MKRAAVLLPVVVALFAAGPLLGRPSETPSSDGWRTFAGTWSASGVRQSLPTGGDRVAATVQISGAVVLTLGEGLSKGFRGEAIGFDDGASVSIGRCVWTDERGDRIFSELKGGPMQTGRRFVGTITGGTGRYAGLTGEYAFLWQYVVQAEDGTIQGRAVELEGRVRAGEARQ